MLPAIARGDVSCCLVPMGSRPTHWQIHWHDLADHHDDSVSMSSCINSTARPNRPSLGAANAAVETITYAGEELLRHITKIPDDAALEDAVLLGRRHPAQLFSTSVAELQLGSPPPGLGRAPSR